MSEKNETTQSLPSFESRAAKLLKLPQAMLLPIDLRSLIMDMAQALDRLEKKGGD